MDYSVIDKYLDGEASEAEIREVFDWIDFSPENRKEFIQYKKIRALTSVKAGNEKKAWSYLQKELFSTAKSRQRLIRRLQIAASIVVALGTGMMFQYLLMQGLPDKIAYQQNLNIEVPKGQMSVVQLPDGTSVHLNSGTKLSYPAGFNSGVRTVVLEGEAFFDVAKDPEHPFMIRTGSLDFKVFGTSFNIQAYPDDQEVNATLVEGSLGILNKSGKELTRMIPGENASYKNEKLTISKENTDLYTSWKEGLITFRNEKLKDVARKIERWYNVEIIIRNPKLGEVTYMGTIMKNKPVDQILEIFALTASLHYSVVPRPDKPTLIYWE